MGFGHIPLGSFSFSPLLCILVHPCAVITYEYI